ncbi:carboxymuconolactone decarboxylase family protein [Oricola cellulosilytica]|uniref:Carboxymuconolactone decarboxylase family protein n=1 Tax=Oricola cellulosilytica TaxID=1429082 RepID=A0A4R0PGC9_9HYPH|nr:carboxymuconolactone decarboxylase family protein [Oricola cellulosilytica]TCD15914.1 carboxymuconolactone decarboxylase family protein [Oricola cellulosilytica]
MAETDWIAFTDQTNKRMAALRKAIPEPAKGFGELAKATISAGALDSKTKELMALAIGITARCDGCLAFHAKAALKYGASREEVLETIAVALYMGGGPSMIYGAEALSVYDAFVAQEAG